MNTNTPTPRTDAAEQRDITGLGVVPVHFARRLERDLARVTAERDGLNQQLADAMVTLDGQRNNFRAVHNQDASELASLRARVSELESQLEMQTTRCIEREERLDNMDACWKASEQRNAELVAALRKISEVASTDGGAVFRALSDCYVIAERALARAESATPAKQSPSIDVESLITYCIPGGSICDPQQVADAIREYLRHQEPCGGQCGDPDCDLDTNGVTMRTPAPHADTVRIDWLDHRTTFVNLYHNPDGKPFVNLAGMKDSKDVRLPALYSDLRAAIDAAMREARQ